MRSWQEKKFRTIKSSIKWFGGARALGIYISWVIIKVKPISKAWGLKDSNLKAFNVFMWKWLKKSDIKVKLLLENHYVLILEMRNIG